MERPLGRMDFVEWASRSLAKGMLPGLVTGLIVGGLGSRLAMRIMAMTSPAARGLETDFGATVGQITKSGTIFLLILGGIVGIAGGIFYVAVRNLLSGARWIRGLSFGIVLLALAGTLLMSPTNPDFLILSPAGLAVAMFSALPLLFGLMFVPLADWLEPRIAAVRRRVLVIVPVCIGLLPLVLAGGLGLFVIAGSLLVWAVKDEIGDQGRRLLRATALAITATLVVWRGAVFIMGLSDILS